MRMLKAGPLVVRALGGNDRAGGGDGPCIVLMHGYGVPGNDLILLPRRVKAGENLRWFFPEGPLEIGGHPGGPARAWYPIDAPEIERRLQQGLSPYPLTAEVPPGMLDAAAQLEACLSVLAREQGLVPARTIVGGFSQGAVMATEVMLAQGPFAGALLMSGRLLDESRMAAPLAALGSNLHVFQSHGTEDHVIPIENGRSLRDALRAHGADVNWHPYGAGHAITSDVYPALSAFCLRHLSPPPSTP
jgi:phospholipase/carboxylesterase